MSAADLDGDGDVDLAVPVAGGVSVLRNNGNGTLAPFVLYPAGGSPWSVAIGDMDGDCHPDLVTAQQGSQSVSILHNNGDGTFAPAADYSVIWGPPGAVYYPSSVALGDLDHDGDLDVAVGTESSWDDTAVLLNQGDGTLGPPVPHHVETCPGIVALSDFNGDQYVDLGAFGLGFDRDKLCVLLNDGSGILLEDQRNYDFYHPPEPFFWEQPSQIAFADLNGDHQDEILVLNTGSATVPANVAVLRNAGGGSFEPAQYYLLSGYDPYSMAIGDMNGDGATDVVVGGPQDLSLATPGWVNVLFNDGQANLTASPTYPAGGLLMNSLKLCDLDSDGDLDVAAVNIISHDFSVLLNNGDGGLAEPMLQPAGVASPERIALGDLDADGFLDLAFSRPGGTQLVGIMRGLGDGTFEPAQFYYPSPQVYDVALADFDADGDLDLAVSGGNGSWVPVTVTVMVNQGDGTFLTGQSIWAPGFAGAGALAVSDINADGSPDIAVVVNFAVAVAFNSSGVLSAPRAYGVGYAYGTGIAVGDLNGDGMAELGVPNNGGETFSILWNRACRRPGADFDGDADVDLADYAVLAACISGPASSASPPGCFLRSPPDPNGDGHSDLRDFAILQDAFGG